MIGRSVVGLDIGSYSVKVTELKAGLRSVRLIRAEELVLPHDAPPEQRQAQIKAFLSENEFPRDFVVTAFPADRIAQRHVRFPFVGAKRIAQAIGFEIEEDLPFPLEDAILAHEQVQSGPGRSDVLAVLAARTDLAEYLESLRGLGTDPRLVEIEGSVLGNLAASWTAFDAARIVLDVGHSKTNVVLLLDGRPVALRSIPIAGTHLTEAIAKQARLGWQMAEEHKNGSGIFEGSGTQPFTPEIGALLDRLVRETARSIQSIVGDPLAPISPTEVVLVGGSARTPGLATYFEERLDLPCRVLGPPPLSSGLEALSAETAPAFAQATALALRGAPTARVTRTDLRQDEFRYVPDLSGLQGQLRLTAGLFALVLGLWVASASAEFITASSHLAQAEAQLGRIYAQILPGKAVPSDPLAELRAELGEARELAAHLGVTGGGLSVLELLRLVTPAFPENHDVRLVELRIERHTIRAQGVSRTYESLDRVREKLAGVEAFSDVTLSDVARIPKTPAQRFSLTIELGDRNE
ncbi:MAG: pilus assembly protein PilM [Deltaproteobacteria bacterium]|nr:pilus assembly protein PilM [Deltaproteobacteria bacterium]